MQPLTDEELRKVLSRNVRFARISSNLTQDVLAEKSDISLNFLKDIEGGRSGTSLLTLVNISRSLNTTPNQLLKDFFIDPCNESENLVQEISFLNDYQKATIRNLINFFKNNDMYV